MGIAEIYSGIIQDLFNRAFTDLTPSLHRLATDKQPRTNREPIEKPSTKHRERLFSSKEMNTLNSFPITLARISIKLSAFPFFKSFNIFFSNFMIQKCQRKAGVAIIDP